MATINLGRVKLVNKGVWSNSTAYAIDDFVQYTDSGVVSTYIAVAASTNQAPSTSGTENSNFWKFLAKGVTDPISGLGNNKIVTTNSSGNAAAVSIGSAGEFLKVNSSANGYEFGAVTPAAVTRLLEVDVTSGTSTIDLAVGDMSAYIMVKILMEDLDVTTDGADVYCGVMQGTPPAYSSQQHEYIASTGGAAISSGTTLGARINGSGLDGNNNSMWSGEFNWMGLGSGQRPSGWGHATYLDGSANRQGCQGFYQFTANENVVTGFRLLLQTGSYNAQGKITVFGYTHA